MCGTAAVRWSASAVHPGQGGRIAWPEHEVVDQQLRAPVEQFGQRLGALLGVERVLLLDRHPRQLGALLGDLLIEVAQLLLALQQLCPRGLVFLLRSDLVARHRRSLLPRGEAYPRCQLETPSSTSLFVPLQTEHAILSASSDHGPRVR